MTTAILFVNVALLTMITAQDLMQAGAHIGHKKSKWNPKMAPFVLVFVISLHIIDVTKTVEKLDEAIKF